MTKTFQIGLIIESLLNILGSATFLLKPDWCLSFAVNDNNIPVPASAATLWQVYAALVLVLTVSILICIPNSPGAYYRRRITFETLAAGEVVLIALLLWHSRHGEESGFTVRALLLAALNLVPALTWHSLVVFLWPRMMVERTGDGDVSDLRKKKI